MDIHVKASGMNKQTKNSHSKKSVFIPRNRHEKKEQRKAMIGVFHEILFGFQFKKINLNQFCE